MEQKQQKPRKISLQEAPQYIFLVLTILSLVFGLIGFVSGETFKADTNQQLKFRCTLNNAIPSVLTNYSFILSYPNGTTAIEDNAVSISKGAFYYDVKLPAGIYKSQEFCYDGTYSYSNTEYYEFTPNGTILSTSNSLIYIFILISLIGLLIFGFYKTGKSVKTLREGSTSWTIFYVCLTYLTLFSLSFIMWVFSTSYLYEIRFISSVFWIAWLILGVMFLPFIILIGAYIMKKQAEILMYDANISQGYSRQESLDMSKRR